MASAVVDSRSATRPSVFDPGWVAKFAALWSAEALGLAALLFGFAVRLVTVIGFDPVAGYDFQDHWKYLTWFRDHLSFPAPNYSREAYHAPLYHFLAGMLVRAGVGAKGLQIVSLAMSWARLALLAIGLRLALPSSPRARLFALMLAAVMPCSVHLDAMDTQEPLSNLLSTLVMVLVLCMFRAEPRRRWGWALALGATAGLELLTKVSGLVLAGVIAVAGPLEAIAVPSSSLRQRFSRLAPWLAAVLVILAVGGWWYVRSHRLYGHAFLSGWDLNPTPETQAAAVMEKPQLDRRSLGYLLGWSADIYRSPYYPSATTPDSRFWPVLVASSFVDYYKYGLAAGGLSRVATAARLSVAAGTLIAAITAVAWLCLVIRAMRRRGTAHLLMLGFPLAGTLGQLSFAIAFPYDWEGVVKGIYLHFALAPLYAVFGLAVEWLRKRPLTRPLAWAALLAIATLATYVFACRRR